MFVLIKELRNLGCLGAFKGIPFNEYLAFIRKSVSYASISITQTIFMQGSSIIVANLFGPAMLAIITIARNVSRFLVMFSSLLSKSIWTELTKLWAKGEVVKFKKIFNKFAIVNSFIITVGFTLMIVFYPFILKWFNINQNMVTNTFWLHSSLFAFFPFSYKLLLKHSANCFIESCRVCKANNDAIFYIINYICTNFIFVARNSNRLFYCFL